MSQLAQVGDFCPNEQCPDYGKTRPGSKRTIKKFGKNRAGHQRYFCKSCGKAFAETIGTIFYRRRTPESEILETLALIAEGVRISAISRVKGHKEDTIIDWIDQARAHAEAIEEILLKDYKITRGQIDGLWSYVANKGAKKTTRRPMRPAVSGDQP